ncbi:leucine-rich repeat-containing protein 74B-like [Chrysoperla carnea]|uniref:leucine-rich repeat-containing protein 74B-like n=1 Tax=Chrysoperla carnea TaxID=189513 RepID=UPI001D06F1B6|nr:leucine-rich repeat-containing protein 74B-like [Chrysoperla carnea]
MSESVDAESVISEVEEQFFGNEGFEGEECEELDETELFHDSENDSVYQVKQLIKYDLKSSSTSSHFFEPPHKIRCLGEIQLSRSSAILNPYRYFEDIKIGVDLNDHLWTPKIKPEYDDIGVERYKDLVKEYKAPIIRDIVDQLGTDTMKLKYYGLNDRSYKILLEVLKYNKHVKYLDLTNNVMTSLDTARAFAEMILHNKTIETINLTNCDIGPKYMKIISERVGTNKFLKELNLSHCNIGDEGCIALAEELGPNTGLEKLNLSFNNLTANCCQELGDAIFDNNNLTDYNLSGNNIKENGFGLLVNNLRDNFTQKIARLNFSKCNLGVENDKSLKILALKISGLKYLDLSFNQITGSALESIAFGMRRNSNLLELNLGYNPLTIDDIILLMDTLRMMRPARKLKILDLSDKYVPKQCSEVIEKVKNKRKVIFRGYLCNYAISGPGLKEMFIKRLKAICELKSKKAKDKNKFGAFFYKIKSEQYVKPSDFPGFFEEICECEKLIKDKDFLRGLASTFTDQTKKVNVGMIRDMFLTAYPETPQPPPPVVEQSQVRRKAKDKKKLKKKK